MVFGQQIAIGVIVIGWILISLDDTSIRPCHTMLVNMGITQRVRNTMDFKHVPSKLRVCQAPKYDRPSRRPGYLDEAWGREPEIPERLDAAYVLGRLLDDPGIGDRSWISSQYDHMLFLLALAAWATLHDSMRLLWLATAFTVGHTITLILAGLEIIWPNSESVEFLIPLTILAVALANMRQSVLKSSRSKKRKARWRFRME